MNITNICVFCSSSEAVELKHFEQAELLGKHIAQNGMTLIYGGAKIGLMGMLARTAKNNGGKVIGVIPTKIKQHELAYNDVDQLIETATMHERKATMAHLADAFIALPGGFGTLEEIIEVITAKQLGFHNKPVVFLNCNNFFHSLFEQFEKQYSENFTKTAYREYYHIANDYTDAMDYIANYKPVDGVAKWF